MSVTIGIDPHKSTHTAVAVDRDEHQIARLTLPVDRHQTDRLLAWAEPLDLDRVWAIESAAGLGRLLAQQLIASGERVVDVPPTLTARVRLLGSSKGSKNDPIDAYAPAIAGLRHCGLRTVTRDGHAAILRLLADRHHDLVGLRTQSACRLHVMLRELSAGGAPIRISAAHGTRFHDAVDVGDDPVAVEGSDSRASISPTCDDSMPSSPRSRSRSRPQSRRRRQRSSSFTVSDRPSLRLFSVMSTTSPGSGPGPSSRATTGRGQRQLALVRSRGAPCARHG